MTIEHTDSTDTVGNPWAAFAPTLFEIPEDRWEEFLRSAPTDTVISLGSSFEELYQKGTGLYWVDLQTIDQAYDDDDTASLTQAYPSQLLSYALSTARYSSTTIKVLRLGGKS